MKRVLITGGGGFLGAWIAALLHSQGIAVRIFDVHSSRHLAQTIVGMRAGAHAPAVLADWQVGDIREASDVQRAMQGCDGVVHLAGILTPDCKADPVRGAQINLMGSLHVFAAAQACGLNHVVYASSAGVYGPHDETTPLPHTHYGTFKLAVEGSARAWWHDHGLGSVGLRPFVVYGPGRETGVSAGPSLACRAAARGESYTVGYTGAAGLVFVQDAAEAFVMALLSPPQGAVVADMVGQVYSVDDVLAEIALQVPGARLYSEGPPLTIAPGISDATLREHFSGLTQTPLASGIAATLDYYRRTP